MRLRCADASRAQTAEPHVHRIYRAPQGRTWLVATIDGDMVLDGSGLGAVRSVASLPAAEAEEIVDHTVKSVFVSRAKTALDALSSSARRRFDAQQRRTANAALTLTVKNAVDGTRVGGAMVTLVTVDGDQVKHARASAGGRLIARVPYGTYKAYARKEGMHAVTETFVVNKVRVLPPRGVIRRCCRRRVMSSRHLCALTGERGGAGAAGAASRPPQEADPRHRAMG